MTGASATMYRTFAAEVPLQAQVIGSTNLR
jgi:hypothetical protein